MFSPGWRALVFERPEPWVGISKNPGPVGPEEVPNRSPFGIRWPFRPRSRGGGRLYPGFRSLEDELPPPWANISRPLWGLKSKFPAPTKSAVSVAMRTRSQLFRAASRASQIVCICRLTYSRRSVGDSVANHWSSDRSTSATAASISGSSSSLGSADFVMPRSYLLGSRSVGDTCSKPSARLRKDRDACSMPSASRRRIRDACSKTSASARTCCDTCTKASAPRRTSRDTCTKASAPRRVRSDTCLRRSAGRRPCCYGCSESSAARTGLAVNEARRGRGLRRGSICRLRGRCRSFEPFLPATVYRVQKRRSPRHRADDRRARKR
jgi:hypothetical protein